MEIPSWVVGFLTTGNSEGIPPEEMEVINRFTEKYDLWEVGDDEYYSKYEPQFFHGRVRYGSVILCWVHERNV